MKLVDHRVLFAKHLAAMSDADLAHAAAEPFKRRYPTVIGQPAGRRGVEVWIGPVGAMLTWPIERPLQWDHLWWRELRDHHMRMRGVYQGEIDRRWVAKHGT